jgi:hypothetical protein
MQKDESNSDETDLQEAAYLTPTGNCVGCRSNLMNLVKLLHDVKLWMLIQMTPRGAARERSGNSSGQQINLETLCSGTTYLL